jgi:hypothetical protein
LEIEATLNPLEEFLDIIAVTKLICLIREEREHVAIPLRGGDDVIVEARDEDALVWALEAIESPNQAPGGVREDRATDTRMNILIGSIDIKLDVADTAQTEILLGDIAIVYTAKLPDAGVGSEEVTMVADKVREVDGADLLFTFDDPLDIDGEIAIFMEEGIDGEETAGDVTLIVTGTASIELIVT